VGCGCGRHCIYMAQRGLNVFGWDISGVAINYARNWAEQESLRVSLEVGNFQKLCFENAYFRGVISWEALYYGKSIAVEEAMAESLRVLCSGGFFLILLKSKKDFRFLNYRKLDQNTCETEQGLLMTCFSRAEIEDLLSSKVGNLNIESLEYSLDNGTKIVSNFIVTGKKL